jgi:hypothetical protein
MKNTPHSIERLLQRHCDFWTGARVKAPLIGKIPTRLWKERPYPLAGGRIARDPTPLRPEEVDIEGMAGAGRTPEPLLFGDLIRPHAYPYPQAWMEAVIGCPITVSAFGCVAKPAGVPLTEAAGRVSVEAALRSEWLPVMERLLRRAGELAGERPVRTLHLRGVIDMLAACLGEEALCTAALEEPGALRALGARCAEVRVAVARRDMALRPLWRGGRVGIYCIYSPGEQADYQIDASSLFSAATYGERFLEHDRAALDAFPYSVTHLHACGLHIIDAILKIDSLRAVQINLDRETGVWDKERMLHYCRKLQGAGRGIILNGELTEGEIEEFRRALRPERLAFYYWNP